MRSEKIVWIGILLAGFFLLAACSGTRARTQELLQQDYRHLSDQELESYYFQLNDQIAREERQATGSSIGVGIGEGPVRGGVSQGVMRATIAEELRERRNEVRAELSRRGLRP